MKAGCICYLPTSTFMRCHLPCPDQGDHHVIPSLCDYVPRDLSVLSVGDCFSLISKSEILHRNDTLRLCKNLVYSTPATVSYRDCHFSFVKVNFNALNSMGFPSSVVWKEPVFSSITSNPSRSSNLHEGVLAAAVPLLNLLTPRTLNP